MPGFFKGHTRNLFTQWNAAVNVQLHIISADPPNVLTGCKTPSCLLPQNVLLRNATTKQQQQQQQQQQKLTKLRGIMKKRLFPIIFCCQRQERGIACLVQCCFTPTETMRTVTDVGLTLYGHLDFQTAPELGIVRFLARDWICTTNKRHAYLVPVPGYFGTKEVGKCCQQNHYGPQVIQKRSKESEETIGQRTKRHSNAW